MPCLDEHCDHDHSDDTAPAQQTLLFSQIDFTQVRTLNESTPNAGRRLLQKPWSHRLDAAPALSSPPDDPQLLLHIPFTGQVRLHSIHVRAPPDAAAPRALRVHVNSPDLDFAAAEAADPTQEFELAQTAEMQDLPVRRARFVTCTSLALFVPDSWGGDESCISYLGLKGDFMRLNREPVSVLYESAARPTDHKVAGVGIEKTGGMGIGGGPGGRTGF